MKRDIKTRLREIAIALNSRPESRIEWEAADRIEALELALKEQAGECFDLRCEMCMRHESLLDTA